jgi:hypothetical protein
MLSTTLAMTPIYPVWLTGRDKTDRTAEAATFELLDRVAHDLILRFHLESVSPSRKKTALSTSYILAGERAICNRKDSVGISFPPYLASIFVAADSSESQNDAIGLPASTRETQFAPR